MSYSRTVFPILLSAGRATDIPGFYGDWFVHRLEEGFFLKRNPYNGDLYVIKTDQTELIVFWTKNPKPLIPQLPFIDKLIPDYYFQFTLNDYDSLIEPGVPDFDERIETFIRLSDTIGKEKVVWRYDPVFLSRELNVDRLIEKIYTIAEKLHPYTSKLVFSFIDIDPYAKVKKKIKASGTGIRELSMEEQLEFASKLSALSEIFPLKISSCAEKIDLTQFGISKNKCIDDELIRNQFPENRKLMDFINSKQNMKDKGQRNECRCIKSTDIGGYNTCMHLCVYCYANHSNPTVECNYANYINNPLNPSIVNK
jgi:hypothetical protein